MFHEKNENKQFGTRNENEERQNRMWTHGHSSAHGFLGILLYALSDILSNISMDLDFWKEHLDNCIIVLTIFLQDQIHLNGDSMVLSTESSFRPKILHLTAISFADETRLNRRFDWNLIQFNRSDVTLL